MTETKPATLINAQTPLSLAINSWKLFLEDQGSSIHTGGDEVDVNVADFKGMTMEEIKAKQASIEAQFARPTPYVEKESDEAQPE